MLSENVWLCASIQIVLFATLQAQAPEDGSDTCRNPPFTKSPFPSNIVPLLDSYDYLGLLGAMRTWNTLDVDGDSRTVSVLTALVDKHVRVPLSVPPSPCSGLNQGIQRVVRPLVRVATILDPKTTG